MKLEKILSIVCYVAGVTFLIIALLGSWQYLFTTSLCFATGFLVSEDAKSAMR